MTDASGLTQYTYDDHDRLYQKQTPQGTLTYTYDPAGNLASMTSSNANGVSVGYTYDSLNRLATVVDNRLVGQNATTYSYDPASNLATVTYPNGLQSTFTYDTLNRVTALSNAAASYTYTLDGTVGNRTGVTEQLATQPHPRIVAWNYDGIYRLTNENISADPNSKTGSVAYGLDPVGNRQSQTSSIPGIATGSFTYDPDDRLNTETYDANGNTLTSASKTFAYDFENRLKSMNNGAVTIQYDADDNRASKTVNGVMTRYLVDDLNPTHYSQVVEEVTAGAVTRTYTYGLQRISQNQLIANAWTPSFYGYDAGGTVRLLSDSTGTVTDTYDFDAFGNTVNTTGSTPNVYLYRGEQYDSDLSLYYLRARYFDSLTGRFLTKDPADGDTTDPKTLHKYLYAGGDPVNRIDPTGWDTILEPNPPKPSCHGLLLFSIQSGGMVAFCGGELGQVQATIPTPKLKCDTPVQRCCAPIVTGHPWLDKPAGACHLRHCWLKTSTKTAGMGPERPGPLPVNPIGIPVKITDQSDQKDGVCTPVFNVDEKCVNNELQIGKSLGNWMPWFQCNSFADAVIARCSESKMPSWGPYGCPLIGPMSGNPNPAAPKAY
jgi:RHS repeat-associated protein